MTQPPVRRQPGIPIWVWILVLIVVIAALWWILAADEEPIGATAPYATEAPAPPATTGFGDGTEMPVGENEMGTGLDTEPIEEPPPPAP